MSADTDMRRMSELLAEARTIAARRNWMNVEVVIDEAQTAILQVRPGNGEYPESVQFRPMQGTSVLSRRGYKG
jgi:hypothetical protein